MYYLEVLSECLRQHQTLHSVSLFGYNYKKYNFYFLFNGFSAEKTKSFEKKKIVQSLKDSDT